jgi:hypothetical protein
MRPFAKAVLAACAAVTVAAPELALAETDPLRDPVVRAVRNGFAVLGLSLFDKRARGAGCVDSASSGLVWCAAGPTYETAEGGTYTRTLGYNLDSAGRIVYVILTRREFPLEREKFGETIKTLGARYGRPPTTLTFSGKTADGDDVSSLVAYWGGIKLVRLTPAEMRVVAQTGTLGRGPLVDHRQDLRRSAGLGDPVYKVEGTAGFIAEFRSVTDVRSDLVLRVVYQPAFTGEHDDKPEPKVAAPPKFRELPLDPRLAYHMDKIRAEQERIAAIERARRAEEERKAAEERARREAAERKAAEERRIAEEKRAAAESARRAEEERRAAEAKRIADAKAAAERRIAEEKAAAERKIAEEKAATERRIAEEKARREAAERAAAAEKARREDSEKKAAEARRLAEERARREEAEREAAEAKRLAEERARLEEAERKAAVERRAIEERVRKAEAEYRASLERAQRAEAERRAAEERARQAEAERKAAEERARRVEAERKAAEQRQVAERRLAERRAAEERAKREEADRKAAIERRAAEERRIVEALKAAEEQRLASLRAAEARRAAEERKTSGERRTSDERRAVDEKPAAEREETEAPKPAEEKRAAEARPPGAASPPAEAPSAAPAPPKPSAEPARPPQLAGAEPGSAGPAAPSPEANREEWLRFAIAQSRNSPVAWIFERVRDRISDDVLLRTRAIFPGDGRAALEITFECNIGAGKRLAAHVRAFDERTNAAVPLPVEEGRSGVVRGAVTLDEEGPQTAFLFPERGERQASIVEIPLAHDDIRKNTPRARAWLRHYRVVLKVRAGRGEIAAAVYPYAENLRRVLEACLP